MKMYNWLCMVALTHLSAVGKESWNWVRGVDRYWVYDEFIAEQPDHKAIPKAYERRCKAYAAEFDGGFNNTSFNDFLKYMDRPAEKLASTRKDLDKKTCNCLWSVGYDHMDDFYRDIKRGVSYGWDDFQRLFPGSKYEPEILEHLKKAGWEMRYARSKGSTMRDSLSLFILECPYEDLLARARTRLAELDSLSAVPVKPQRATGAARLLDTEFAILPNGHIQYTSHIEGSVAVMGRNMSIILLQSGMTKQEVEGVAMDAGVEVVKVTADEWIVGRTTIRFEEDRFTILVNN